MYIVQSNYFHFQEAPTLVSPSPPLPPSPPPPPHPLHPPPSTLHPSGALDALLRSLVIGKLGNYSDSAVVEEAQSRFHSHCSKESCLPADLKVAVFNTSLAHGGDTVFDQLLQVSSTRSGEQSVFPATVTWY